MSISRTRPETIRPLLDVEKANGTFILCDDKRCTGQCTPEHLADIDLGADTVCGPHRGTCIIDSEGGAGGGGGGGACVFLQLYGEGEVIGSWYGGAIVVGPLEMSGLKLERMAYGAIIGGTDNLVKSPQGGGVLGLAPTTCSGFDISCFPSFVDQLAEERGVPKTVAYCGHPVRTCCGQFTRARAPNLDDGHSHTDVHTQISNTHQTHIG